MGFKIPRNDESNLNLILTQKGKNSSFLYTKDETNKQTSKKTTNNYERKHERTKMNHVIQESNVYEEKESTKGGPGKGEGQTNKQTNKNKKKKEKEEKSGSRFLKYLTTN